LSKDEGKNYGRTIPFFKGKRGTLCYYSEKADTAGLLGRRKEKEELNTPT